MRYCGRRASPQPLAPSNVGSSHRGKWAVATARTYCSYVTYIASLRPSPIAIRTSLESHFLLHLSSFSFCHRSAHFFLHDLSRIPTNFRRWSLLPLTTYFAGAIFSSLRLCVASYVLYFANAYCANAPVSLVDFSDLLIRNYALDTTRPTVSAL